MKVLFFASLKERLGCAQLDVSSDPSLNTAQDLINLLINRGESWQDALQTGKVLIAVNQEMARPHTPIHSGDEIAFFPPVTGG